MPRVGVVLLQLGTPDAPTAGALRRYLREFLSDPRVVDLSPAIWWPVLYGIVLRTRPARSAELYAKVWTDAGSPLAVTSADQAAALESRLSASAGDRIPVVVGMRYGQPSIAAAVDRLTKDGVDRILAFPMYPQYAGATTGSSLEKLFDVVKTMRVVPSVRVVPPYYEDPAWLDAVAAVTTRTLESLPFKPDRVLFSFHGLPKRYAALGDPYPRQCEASARLLAGRMHLAAEQTLLVFQSRFGREEWLQPYADVTIGALGREGLKIAVVTPGFTADCLETIEEIGLRGAEQFHESGGKDYARVPCVNTDDTWLAGMATIARRELSGWL